MAVQAQVIAVSMVAKQLVQTEELVQQTNKTALADMQALPNKTVQQITLAQMVKKQQKLAEKNGVVPAF
jgi:hypothetical protein